MLEVRGRLEHGQAIIGIGVQRFQLAFNQVEPVQTPALMPIASYRALLDTGAQRTCLTYRTIAQEGLQRHGKRFIKNVHDENVHSLFMVRLGFWCQDDYSTHIQDSSRSYYGMPDPVEVINIADNDRFDAIIGMDILSRFEVHFGRSGEFCIAL